MAFITCNYWGRVYSNIASLRCHIERLHLNDHSNPATIGLQSNHESALAGVTNIPFQSKYEGAVSLDVVRFFKQYKDDTVPIFQSVRTTLAEIDTLHPRIRYSFMFVASPRFRNRTVKNTITPYITVTMQPWPVTAALPISFQVNDLSLLCYLEQNSVAQQWLETGIHIPVQ